ncbi:complement C1q-like protein 4 [Engraulis encrasicolus]|uniref:complement C1q-like protein 4 n=1 Tax=Engraulis encrasicolus TaxID=184585 RepID=UPI002FD1A10E
MYFCDSTKQLTHALEHTSNALRNRRASRSAFSVALTDKLICVGPYPADSTIIYNHVFVNLDDRYNTSTGIFTAPHSGVYNLALTVYSNSISPGSRLSMCVQLMINGVPRGSVNDNNYQDREDSSSVSFAERLSVGDQVWVTLRARCFLCDDSSHRNIFSGFLAYD